MTDISPEAVARGLDILRDPNILEFGRYMKARIGIKDAADMLEALSARLAEVEAERDEMKRRVDELADIGHLLIARAEAAEAENAKLRDIGDAMAASIEGNYFLPGIATKWRNARAALQETSPQT